MYSEVKLRICGIFKYFFDRYSTDYENHRRFIGGYQKLMKYGMQFPVNSTIVENTMYKGAKKVTDKGSYITKKDSNTPTKSDSFGSMPPKQTDSGSMKVILHEIEQTAASGERDLQKSI